MWGIVAGSPASSSILVRHHDRDDRLALVAWADLKLEIEIPLPPCASDDDSENHCRCVDLALEDLRHIKHVMKDSGIVVAVEWVLNGLLHDPKNR